MTDFSSQIRFYVDDTRLSVSRLRSVSILWLILNVVSTLGSV